MPGAKLATGLGMMVLTIIIHALFMVGWLGGKRQNGGDPALVMSERRW